MPHTENFEPTLAWLGGLVDHLPGVAYRCLHDAKRSIEFISGGCRALLEAGPDQLMGERGPGLSGLMLAEDAVLARRLVAEALEDREPFELTFRIRRADGTVRWISDRGRVVVDADGTAVATEGFLTDVTGPYAVQAKLAEQERIFAAVFEQTLQLVGLLDRDGRVIRANRSALNAIGATTAEVIGRFFWETAWWRHSAESQQRMREAIRRAAAGEVVRFEACHPKPDGSLVYVDFSLSPVHDEQGRVVALIPEGHDITERRLAGMALQESQEKLARAFAASPDAISITDLVTGFLIEVNEGFERLFEWPRDACLGHSTLQLGLWASEHDRDRLIEGLIRDGRVRGLTAVGRTRSGRRVQCTITGELVEIAGKKAIILVVRDVTEQTRADQALHESEERMRLLIEHAPDAIVVLDADAGQFLTVNAAAERLFRTPRERLIGRGPGDFSPERQPDGRLSSDASRAFMAAALAGERPVFEWIHRVADGTEVPCEVRLLRLPDPEAIHVRGSITDLSERKRAERAFRALLEGTAGVSGPAFFEATVARLAREIGVRAALVGEVESARGQTWMRCLARWVDGPVERCEVELGGTVFEAVLEQPCVKIERGAAVHFPADAFLGEIRAEGFLGMPVRDRAGGVLGIVAVFDDKPLPDSEAMRLLVAASAARAAVEIQHRRSDEAIHELNSQLERRVVERTGQLAAANAELESFSYSVSHDLRSPLRAIDGFSRALEEDFGPLIGEEGRHFIQRIRGASQRMGLLIDDLLRLSRATRVEMKRERVDLSEIAAHVMSDLRRHDPDREVEFACEPGLRVSADRALVGILLQNLLDNAWKYSRRTKGARIRFARAQLASPEADGSDVFMVADNGAGFDMRYVGKLFAPFQRLHGPTEFEGSGIGLATVRRIAVRHGGRAWIEGAVGEGATVYFTLGPLHV